MAGGTPYDGGLRKHGMTHTFLAFLLWGLLPFYWKLLGSVSEWEILANRVVWSAVFMAIFVAVRRRDEIRALIRSRDPYSPRVVAAVVICAVTLGTNWFIYVLSVNTDHIVEASLGYYINPLFVVLLGMIFLKERLRGAQVVALLLAFAGVLLLTIRYGHVPWASLGITLSFGLYGLVKKVARLGAALGLLFEMIVLLPVSLALIGVYSASGRLAFGTHGAAGGMTTLLLIGSGAVTAIPLLLFGEGARRVPLSTVGFFQYLSPTLMLLIGTLAYGEPFGIVDGISFGLIWTALAIYTTTTFRRRTPDERAVTEG